ncbi:MAG: RNA polymerase sigma factor [Gemmataceae bacterium]
MALVVRLEFFTILAKRLNFASPARNLMGRSQVAMDDPADRIYERLLLLRCQAGNADAFAELVERYGPRLRYFVRRMLGDDDTAEDVLQEVWLDVFRGLGGLLDLGAFPAWVYRIARDRTARRLRRPQLPREPAKDVSEIEAAGGAEEFSAEDAAAIHAALSELTPDQREVLVLRFLEEMSYDDIAKVVGGPVGTVRSRLHYAKRALRTILERKTKHE